MRLLSLILLFLVSGLSHAEETRYYDVEIIIFENTESSSRDSETWPVNYTFSLPEKVVELGEPFNSEWLPEGTDPKYSFVSLPAESYELKEELERLTNSTNRRVLLHARWRQPGMSQEIALPVHFTRIISPLPGETNNSAQQLTQPDDFNSPLAAPVPPQLEGLLRVTLSRYLHLEAELAYRTMQTQSVLTPSPLQTGENRDPIPVTESKPVVYYLNQNRRRMRSNELHYIDHPVLGILIKISPFVPEVAPQTEPVQKPLTPHKGSINR